MPGQAILIPGYLIDRTANQALCRLRTPARLQGGIALETQPYPPIRLH